MSDPEKPKTPLLLVLLAVLVVGGVYLVYDEGRFGQKRDLEYWASNSLSLAEIGQRLSDESSTSEETCHALIQMELAGQESESTELIELVALLRRAYERGDDRVRQLTAFTARRFRGDVVVELLGEAIGDDVATVRLEAAVGLAALRDLRAAPLLADAIDAVRPDHVLRRRELLRAYSLVAVVEHQPRIEEWLRVAQLDTDAESVKHCQAAIAGLPHEGEGQER